MFDDIVTDGIWLHCNSCLAHGDIITFGAQIWNTSLPHALSKMAELGVITPSEADKAAADYDRAFSRQKAAETFWTAAASQLWNHSDDLLACRIYDIGLKPEYDVTNLVGAAHPDQVLKLCRELGRAKPRLARKDGSSLVLPYYTLPGRLSGFLLLHYSADAEMRKTFIPVSGYDRQRVDAGYCFLPNLLLPPPTVLKNKQFVVEDQLWALKEQCRQFKYGLPALPIVAGYAGPEAISYGTNWSALPPTPRFFQGNAATPELLSQAANGKGYVSVVAPDVAARPSCRYTLQCLAKICSAADTWQSVLNKTLAGHNEMTSYSFATKLAIEHSRLQLFFKNHGDQFSEDFVKRVLQTIDLAPTAPTRTHKKWVLVEQDNAWWNHVGQQVCNARVVITQIMQADDGEKIYAGRVCMRDWEITFTENARRIEHMGLLAYAAAIAAPHGKLITYDRSWNKRSHLISIQLHSPVLTLVSTKTGWDEQASMFRFRDYAFTNAGETINTPAIIKQSQAVSFPEPLDAGPIGVRRFLTAENKNAFVWGVFGTIAANLIAPIVRKDCVATAISGVAFNTAARIGAALGCQQRVTSTLHRASVADFLRKNSADLLWPVFLASEFNDADTAPSITHIHNRPVIVRMPESGAVAALGYGWNKISTGVAPDTLNDFSDLRYVLPAYIRHTLLSRMNLVAKSPNLVISVLTDLHTWLDEVYGATFHLPQTLQQFGVSERAHEALIQEIVRGVHHEKLDVIPRPRRKMQPKNYLLRRKEFWWLNRRAIDNYFTNDKNIPPNWLGVINLLINDGVFGGEETVQGMPGILVSTPWCDNYWTNNEIPAREIG